MTERLHVAIVGGCGHVGLPLGVKLALAGFQTTLIDIDVDAVRKVNAGVFPFAEQGGDRLLSRAVDQGLVATNDKIKCENADAVVFVTGTPVDEHLNPKVSEVVRILDMYLPHVRNQALIVMRSTLFPGTMAHLYNRMKQRNIGFHLAFCPERVAQGFALEEIDVLPQIVSAFEEDAFQAAYQLFAPISPKIIRLAPLEAEMAKLMANSWRYLEFAIANQFYMIAEDSGVDFFRVYEAIRYEYPRARGYKGPGFSAGPCLFKDTMQLASFFDHKFYMGHAAMLVNEGLATFVVNKIISILGGSLWGKTVGLLGMTFKADNDDIRESLSFKVKKGLEFHGANVIFHDPFIADATPLSELLDRSDAVALTTPHREYRGLALKQPMIDVWGIYSSASLQVLPGKNSELS